MCDEVFRLAHGLSRTAIPRGWQASLKDLKSVPKKAKPGQAINDHDTNDTKGSERQEQTLEWMNIWVGHHGCLQPDSDIVYIDDVTMDDMWREH